MAKMKKKRRAWTAGEVRDLKSDGEEEDHRGANREEAEADRRRDAPEGVQHRVVARLPFLKLSNRIIIHKI